MVRAWELHRPDFLITSQLTLTRDIPSKWWRPGEGVVLPNGGHPSTYVENETVELSMVAQACNPGVWKAEVGESSQSQPGMQNEFQVTLGYTARPCLKKQEPKQMNTWDCDRQGLCPTILNHKWVWFVTFLSHALDLPVLLSGGLVVQLTIISALQRTTVWCSPECSTKGKEPFGFPITILSCTSSAFQAVLYWFIQLQHHRPPWLMSSCQGQMRWEQWQTQVCCLLAPVPAFLLGKKLLQHAVVNLPRTLFCTVMTLFSEVDKLM